MQFVLKVRNVASQSCSKKIREIRAIRVQKNHFVFKNHFVLNKNTFVSFALQLFCDDLRMGITWAVEEAGTWLRVTRVGFIRSEV